MKILLLPLLALSSLPLFAQMAMDHPAQPGTAAAPERLGTVSFSVSCAASVQAPFNRGVALLHDFWYEEADRQFEEIAKADPGCAMAHWGAAMSFFHQIWNRPSESSVAQGWAEIQKAQSPSAKTARERAYIAALSDFYRPGKQEFPRSEAQGASSVAQGWAEIQKAQSPSAKTARERAYIAALSDFYRPGKQEFPERVQAYSDAMGKLYGQYPDDIDAGAFYALSLLAAEPSGDTSLSAERKAMEVLTPLFAKHPDNPGLVHYTIHSCDNPAMAAKALTASNHYGEIAPSGAHAYHMPGHIYARLGMWRRTSKQISALWPLQKPR